MLVAARLAIREIRASDAISIQVPQEATVLHRALSDDRRIYRRDEVRGSEPKLDRACAGSVVAVVAREREFAALVLFSSCAHHALNIVLRRQT